MTLETAAYLGTGLFFGLLVLLAYRWNNKPKQTKQKLAVVPLRPNRTTLLEGQRQAVTDRRNRLKSVSDSKPPEQLKPPPETRSAPVCEGPLEDGFGEDLGMALTMNQSQATAEKEKRSRNTGRSRFAALQDAADQFKDIYNRNSKL